MQNDHVIEAKKSGHPFCHSSGFFKELFTKKEPRKVKAVDGIDLTIPSGEIVSW